MTDEFRIVMIGPHGERDYVEKIVSGVPCICGDRPQDAQVFSGCIARSLVSYLKRFWLYPHVDVVLSELT